MRTILGAIILTAAFVTPGQLAAQTTTVVTTYVVKTQEEREKSRWTLTEWLRIKERIRMMDVWLALFSDPKKDTFRPELNLVYGMTRGDLALTDAAGTEERAGTSGMQGRVQLWLTNILTGTVGLRTLNADLGGEGYLRASGEFRPEAAQTAAEGSTDSLPVAQDARGMRHGYATGNLRLFGASTQDSSLVLKYGQYASQNTVPNWADATSAKDRRGIVAGAEAQLYLIRFLGIEGNYLAYGDKSGPAGSDAQRGSYHDYMGFLEVSFVRLMLGRYAEEWAFDGGATKLRERGTVGGIKLQL